MLRIIGDTKLPALFLVKAELGVWLTEGVKEKCIPNEMHPHGHWPMVEQVRAPRRGGHFLQPGCKVGRAENILWPGLLP